MMLLLLLLSCSISLHRYLVAAWAGTAGLLVLDVRAKLDVLVEIADVAADVAVGLEREGYDGDEAEREPFPVPQARLARPTVAVWRVRLRREGVVSREGWKGSCCGIPSFVDVCAEVAAVLQGT